MRSPYVPQHVEGALDSSNRIALAARLHDLPAVDDERRLEQRLPLWVTGLRRSSSTACLVAPPTAPSTCEELNARSVRCPRWRRAPHTREPLRPTCPGSPDLSGDAVGMAQRRASAAAEAAASAAASPAPQVRSPAASPAAAPTAASAAPSADGVRALDDRGRLMLGDFYGCEMIESVSAAAPAAAARARARHVGDGGGGRAGAAAPIAPPPPTVTCGPSRVPIP